MGGFRKRGRSFEINYRDADGRRQFETIATDDPDIAKSELKKREGDVEHGLPVTAKLHTVPFIDLARDVMADYRINHRRSLDDLEARFRLHILPILGDRKASLITTAHLRRYIEARQAEGARSGTINRELEAIRRAYCLAIKEGRLLLKPYIPMLKESNARQGFFERDEFEAIRRHLPEHAADAALCGYITGWRISEIGALEISNVDLEAGELRLEPHTTKNDEGRVFPFNRELRGLIEKRLALLQGLRKRGVWMRHLFWYETSRKEIRRLKRFDKAWATAAERAGLPVVILEMRNHKGEILRVKRGKRKGLPKLRRRSVRIFHDFRRTACRNLIRRGMPEKLAMQMVGWKDRAMLDRYHIVAKSDLDLARKLMDGEFVVAETVAIAPKVGMKIAGSE
jgi:integrase